MRKYKIYNILAVILLLGVIGCPSPVIDPPPPPELIQVEVCGDTLRLPNEWCPPERLETRQYVVGTEPTELCDFHKEPEPEIPKLEERFTYPVLKVPYGAWFLKAGGFLKEIDGYTTEDFQTVIDEIAERNMANVVRMMPYYWSNNDWVNDNEIDMVHPKVNGLYDLHQVNPVWWNKLKIRVAYCAERRITVALTLNNQSMIRNWDWGWLHQSNNSGWNGEETYIDSYGWTKWVHVERDPDYGTADERRWYLTTRDYLLWLYDFIFTGLEPYKEWIIVDNNEIDGGAFWHSDFAAICDQYGYGREKRITSVRAVDWIVTKSSIYKDWPVQIHSVFTMDDYESFKAYLGGIVFCPSGDGGGESWWHAAGVAGVAAIVRQSLFDGNQGFVGNTEGKWSDPSTMAYPVGEAMRNEIIYWLQNR